MNKKNLVSSIVLICGVTGISTTVQAALTNGSTLNFDPGVLTCISSCTSYPLMAVTSGSYFAIDGDINNKISASEKTALSMHDGLVLGAVQTASGSGSDEIPVPGIDNPWSFYGSTGMHFTSSPTNVLSTSGNTATVDFSGWNVTWNGIPAINMGSGAWNPISGTAPGPYYNGVANVVCGVDCGDGDTYTLDYSATVPLYDPSGFGAVHFFWHLEGTVSAVPVPAAFWLFGSGLLGLLGVARSRK